MSFSEVNSSPKQNQYKAKILFFLSQKIIHLDFWSFCCKQIILLHSMRKWLDCIKRSHIIFLIDFGNIRVNAFCVSMCFHHVADLSMIRQLKMLVDSKVI